MQRAEAVGGEAGGGREAGEGGRSSQRQAAGKQCVEPKCFHCLIVTKVGDCWNSAEHSKGGGVCLQRINKAIKLVLVC